MIRIAHLADIHIQDRRRAEYAAVMGALYSSLRAEAPTLIAVVGDVFDNKMRASPNNLADVADFLTALVGIAPVVLIPGNHDCNQLTPGSLDLLTPLLADRQVLQPPRLTYFRHSGVYVAHGIVWTVIATDGGRPPATVEEEAWARRGQEELPRVCLFHEEVNGALLPTGGVLRGYKLSVADLDRYDAALGGHIHCRQKFTPRAGYCGSLVQQNVGEPHRGHGYVMWALEPSAAHRPYRTAPPDVRGIDIPNHLGGFARVEVDAAGLDTTARPLPARPIYWELAHDPATSPERVAELAAEYETAWGMPPRAVRLKAGSAAAPSAPAQAPGGAAPATAGGAEARELGAMASAQAAARTLEAHEEIITELLGDDPALQAVLALHRERYSGLVPSGSGAHGAGSIAGARFRLLRLEFADMYAFGPDNAIDFARLEGGVSGVVAPNHSGKTSLIDALLYALYEEHPRAPKKKDVVRRGAPGCRLSLDFELDGKVGRIEKAHSSGRAHSANSQYRFVFDGEDRTQGGTVETLAEIRKLLGGPAAALASSFQLQGGENGGFIGATPPERKKLLAATLELGSFEALERAVTKELTAAGAEARVLDQQYRGAPAHELAAREAVERAELARFAAVAASFGALSTELAQRARAAAASSSEAAATAARAAEQARLAELAGAEGAPLCALLARRGLDSAGCASAAKKWAAALGAEPARLEASAALALEPPPAEPPADLPSEEALRSAESAVTRAEAAVQLTAARALAVAGRQAAPPPRDRERAAAVRAQGLARGKLEAARAALDAARGLTEAPGLPPRPEPPPAAAPAARADPSLVLACWAGVSSGLRPTPDEVAGALAQLGSKTEASARADYARSVESGAAFRPAELAAAKASLAEALASAAPEWGAARRGRGPDLAKLAAAGERAAALAETAARRVEAAAGEDAAARAALQCLPPSAREAAAAHPEAGPELADPKVLEAAERARSKAAAWSAAAAHLAAIREKHTPTLGCPGCAAMAAMLSPAAENRAAKALLAAETARDRSLAASYLSAARRAQASADELSAAGRALAEARAVGCAAAAASRVVALEAAAAAARDAAAWSWALSVLDRARYWADRDAFASAQQEAAAQQWMAENARALDALREKAASALSAAMVDDFRASAELARLTAELADSGAGARASAQREAASAAADEAAKELSEAQSALGAAGARREQLAAARRAAESSAGWWAAAERALAAAARRASAAAELASAEEGVAALEAAAEEAARAAEGASAERVAALRAEAAHQREADRLAAQRAAEEEREAAFASAAARRDALRAYRAVLRPTGGIGDHLLGRARALLARRINEGLRELGARFVVAVTADFDVYHAGADAVKACPGAADGPGADPSPQSPWLPVTLASGYQRFALNLAARLAIWRLSAAPRPDALIVDEGFGACDEDYLELLAAALEALAVAPGAPRLIFVVSHVDALKARLAPERALDIAVGPNGSRISNSAGPGAAAPKPPPAAPAPARGPPRSGPGAELPPDVGAAGSVWCDACQQSLRAGWARKHLSSAKHAAAVRKLGGV